ERLTVEGCTSLDDKSIDSVFSVMQFVFLLHLIVKRTQMEPSILMYPHPYVFRIRRNDLLEFVFPIKRIQRNLIISGSDVPFIRKHPYLKQFYFFILVLIEFAVINSRSGTHHLNVSMTDNSRIAHTVFVLQITL